MYIEYFCLFPALCFIGWLMYINHRLNQLGCVNNRVYGFCLIIHDYIYWFIKSTIMLFNVGLQQIFTVGSDN